MNKRQIIASLSEIAETLDNTGLFVEANTVTNVMKRLAQEDKYEFFIIDKVKDKYKILVTNSLDKDPLPKGPLFDTEKKAIQEAKKIAYKNATDRKPITDKDREDAKPAIEKIRQLMKNK